MNVEKELKKLAHLQLQKPNRVFSMYLNTDRSDPEQQGGKWKIHLKNGLNDFENYLKESKDVEEMNYFTNIRKKVEMYIHEHEQNLKKSVIIFASGDGSVWFAERLQMRVKTEFHWEDRPYIEPLQQLYEHFPKTGIILTQQDEVKIIEAELGMLKNTQHYEFDINTEDWREAAGPHHTGASMGSGGKNTQREQYDERFEANRHRWYKRLASDLDQMAKKHDWHRIYIVGQKEDASQLDEHMNKEVTEVINKNLLDHEEMKVINEIVA